MKARRADGRERHAGGWPFVADDFFEVAQVAVGELGGTIGEEDEMRHGDGEAFGLIDLRGVEQLEGNRRVAH